MTVIQIKRDNTSGSIAGPIGIETAENFQFKLLSALYASFGIDYALKMV
jgi:hypothetical protein